MSVRARCAYLTFGNVKDRQATIGWAGPWQCLSFSFVRAPRHQAHASFPSLPDGGETQCRASLEHRCSTKMCSFSRTQGAVREQKTQESTAHGNDGRTTRRHDLQFRMRIKFPTPFKAAKVKPQAESLLLPSPGWRARCRSPPFPSSAECLQLSLCQ